MTTALDDIEGAARALNDLAAQERAEKDRIDAAVAAALAAILAPTRTVFLDAAAGSDANDGTTAPKAVRTPQKAAGLVSAGQAGTVILCSDVTLTAPLAVQTPLAFISDWLAAAGYDTGAVRRKISVAASAFGGPGTVAINQVGEGGQLLLNGVELHVAGVPSGAGLAVIGVRDALLFASSTVSWDAGLGVPIVQPFAMSKVYFGQTTLPANYAGLIFAGVAAGGNLNNDPRYCRTNLTSA